MAHKRIETIVSLVPKNANVLDIGTDHCFVPIFLFKKEITKKLTALDINPNPLKIAKENLINAKMENKVTLLLNDGLNDLDPNQYDVIIVAGMGGETISQIIDQKKYHGKLILHPTNNEISLRKVLTKNNFEIVKELIIEEKKVLNLIIEANFNPKEQNLTSIELLIGPKLLTNNSKETTKYYEKKLLFCQNLYDKSKKQEYQNKAIEYQKALIWRKNNLEK